MQDDDTTICPKPSGRNLRGAGVAYLASDDAAFITGLELYIDGGYTAR